MPKQTPVETARSALSRALDVADGATGLAKALASIDVTLTSQAISQWDCVPPSRVIAVEKVTGVPRHELRPDIYPEPAGASS